MIEQPRQSRFDWIALAISRLGMALVAILVGVMFFEVVSRYAFARPTLWANELSLWLGGTIYLMAVLYATQQRSHIAITILYDWVPRSVQRIFDTISVVLVCLFAMALVWGGFGEARQKLLRWETFGTAWDPPIPAVMKPLVLLVFVLVAVQMLVNLVVDWKKPKQVHDLIAETVKEIGLAETQRQVEGPVNKQRQG